MVAICFMTSVKADISIDNYHYAAINCKCTKKVQICTTHSCNCIASYSHIADFSPRWYIKLDPWYQRAKPPSCLDRLYTKTSRKCNENCIVLHVVVMCVYIHPIFASRGMRLILKERAALCVWQESPPHISSCDNRTFHFTPPPTICTTTHEECNPKQWATALVHVHQWPVAKYWSLKCCLTKTTCLDF